MTRYRLDPKYFHRTNAMVLAVFVLAHIVNHLVALAGPRAHVAAMEWLRLAYRQPAVETVLLASVAFQALSGGRLLLQPGSSRRKGIARWQAYSGAYLAIFLVIHLSAIAWARLVVGLDTNFYFAAAGLNVAPYPWFFVPYYFLAVLAIFVHGAFAIGRVAWNRSRAVRPQTVVYVGLAAGAVAASLIIASFCGFVQPVTIAPAYLATFN